MRSRLRSPTASSSVFEKVLAGLVLRVSLRKQRALRPPTAEESLDAETEAALEAAFSDCPDGVMNDTRVFGERVVVPLLGLGVYMTSKLPSSTCVPPAYGFFESFKLCVALCLQKRSSNESLAETRYSSAAFRSRV